MENIKQAIKSLSYFYNPTMFKYNFYYKPEIEKFKSSCLINNLSNESVNDETMEKAVKSKATDDDIEKLNRLEIEIEELKEKLKENYDINIEKNLEEKEKELKDLIDENENNVVELKELIDRNNKFGLYVPIEKSNKNSEEEEEEKEEKEEEYRSKLIFDGKNVILQDINGNEIEKVSYTKFGKEMFFEILEDIYVKGEESMFFIKNYNNLSIADIILKHCRILNQNNEKIISLDDIIYYCSNKNMDVINENFVKIFFEIGDVEVIKYCVLNKAKLNKINELAYSGNNYELIHILEDIDIKANFDCLLNACSTNDLYLINYLLNNNEYDKDDFIELFSVIKDPRIADLILKELLKKGFDINTSGIFSKDKETMKAPLHLAVENNHTEVVQYLLNEKLTGQKININKQVERKKYIAQKDFINSETALNFAIENENKEIVEMLLKCTDINVKLGDILCCAVLTQNIEIIKLLIGYPNIDINSEDVVYYVIESNNTKIIDLFLKQPNLDLGEKREDSYIMTLFGMAVKNNNIELAKILLSQPNADINAKYTEIIHGGSYEMAPLHFAIDNNNVEMVKFLLSQPNIDVNIKFIIYNYGKNNYKNSISVEIPILYYAMRYKPDNYADATLRDYSKTTNPEIVKLLLSHPNIDVNEKYIEYYRNGNKENEETSLYMATKLPGTKEYEEKLKAVEIFKLLVSHPSLDISAESVKYDEYGNIKGKKMLFYEAIKAGNVEAAIFLLPYNKNIDINKKYKCSCYSYEFEETLLHMAIKSNTAEVVDFLLTNYSNIDINAEYIKYKYDKIKEKGSPITMAIFYRRNEEISEFLLKNPNIDVNTEHILYYKNGNIKEKRTPIYMAIFYNDKKLVELLLKNPNLDLDKKSIKYDKDGNIKEEETILYSAARSLWCGKEIFELVVNEKIRRIKEKKVNIKKMMEEIIKQKNELNELKKCEELKDAFCEIKKYEEKLDNIENEIGF